MANSKVAGYIKNNSKCAVIVAHPDDETLWAGGTILMHPNVNWTIITICRKSDRDRAPKFYRALEYLGATGNMADLNDDPEQLPLDSLEIQNTILNLLPSERFDLIITHGFNGEYTRHARHEETSNAVMTLCENKKLSTREVWRFAYEDGGKKYLPRPIQHPDKLIKLSEEIWKKKYYIITNIYGFGHESFEAQTTPRSEAFQCLHISTPNN